MVTQEDREHQLSQAIKRYWRERGWQVETRIEMHSAPGEHGKITTHGVRSDMLGGMPRRRLQAAA